MNISSRPGFTLIEVMIAVSIIVILAAIFTNSFSPVKNRASDSARIAKVQEVTLAITQYHADCGFYPRSLSDSENNNGICNNQFGDFITGSGDMSDITYVSLVNNAQPNRDKCGGFHIGITIGEDAENRLLEDDDAESPLLNWVTCNNSPSSSLNGDDSQFVFDFIMPKQLAN